MNNTGADHKNKSIIYWSVHVIPTESGSSMGHDVHKVSQEVTLDISKRKQRVLVIIFHIIIAYILIQDRFLS